VPSTTSTEQPPQLEHPSVAERAAKGKAARAKVQGRLLAMLARHERGTRRFHPHLQRGHAVRLIRASAARIHADLIVMSKRSRSKLEVILLGSVTERVVADLQNDVLVVPLVRDEKTAVR